MFVSPHGLCFSASQIHFPSSHFNVILEVLRGFVTKSLGQRLHRKTHAHSKQRTHTRPIKSRLFAHSLTTLWTSPRPFPSHTSPSHKHMNFNPAKVEEDTPLLLVWNKSTGVGTVRIVVWVLEVHVLYARVTLLQRQLKGVNEPFAAGKLPYGGSVSGSLSEQQRQMCARAAPYLIARSESRDGREKRIAWRHKGYAISLILL